MKTTSSTLISYLNTVRASPDVPLIMADAFTFTLRAGLMLCYTNVDVTFSYTPTASNLPRQFDPGRRPQIQGFSVGLEVDQQQITIAALATDTVTGGAPFLQALRDGAFDGCEIERMRVFFSDRIGGTAIGAVTLFKGRLGDGRSDRPAPVRKLTVNSDLVLLDIDMPRNIYQPTCLHTLYDSGCTLIKNAFRQQRHGRAPARRLRSSIGPAPTRIFSRDSITFTSGVNVGVTANVDAVVAGTSLTLGYPLQSTPAAGDTFTVYYGCDHTPGTCQSKFGNLANFRGFPYVPPPQMAI